MATIAEWITYAAARGRTVADEPASEQALQRGVDHINFRYIPRLAPQYSADNLAVVDPATYEAAWLELQTPGFFNRTFTPDQQKVLTQVGSVKWTPVGEGANMTYGAMPTSSLIDAMFEPYIIDPDREGFRLTNLGGTK